MTDREDWRRKTDSGPCSVEGCGRVALYRARGWNKDYRLVCAVHRDVVVEVSKGFVATFQGRRQAAQAALHQRDRDLGYALNGTVKAHG